MEIERFYFLSKVDKIGRILLPIEIREKLEIKEADTLKIYIQDGKIVIENKYII